jgi:hypothetical protein
MAPEGVLGRTGRCAEVVILSAPGATVALTSIG